ncbi:hypothetical protein SSX86_032316 [Deinandra increscens subsp. villosa]|uniref:Uncharacterized protein n=1 Tax=Deinandra increscens subsp. villosa TaxID=3103831 RepID=A0AAP0GGQ8_9ASTR
MLDFAERFGWKIKRQKEQVSPPSATPSTGEKMEHRLANSLTVTVKETKFIEDALVSDIRVDGRRPFDYRNLIISEDGSSEVKLGRTQVIAFVTDQLVQPYRDRPNEGTFAIYTEFSPMLIRHLNQVVLGTLLLSWVE